MIGPLLSTKILPGKGNVYDYMQAMINESKILSEIIEFEVLQVVET